MCLSRTDIKPSKLKAYKERYGYKIFNIYHAYDGKKQLWFQIKAFKRSKVVPIGKWLFTEPKRPIGCGSNIVDKYLPGFHIYLKRPTAWTDQKVVKVKFKHPICTGYQDFKPVVIAKSMYVPKPKGVK
jgi:hypothetical protein